MSVTVDGTMFVDDDPSLSFDGEGKRKVSLGELREILSRMEAGEDAVSCVCSDCHKPFVIFVDNRSGSSITILDPKCPFCSSSSTRADVRVPLTKDMVMKLLSDGILNKKPSPDELNEEANRVAAEGIIEGLKK